MSDNTRLSSSQALEDYFDDLLLEPELELEPEPVPEPAPEPEPGYIAEQPESETAQPAVDSKDIPAPDRDEVRGEDSPRRGFALSQDAGVLTSQVAKAAELAKPVGKSLPAAKPFDFASLDGEGAEGGRGMPSPVLHNVQRLLNQVSQLNPQAASEAEASTMDAELADEWQLVMAHEQAKDQPAAPLPAQQVDGVAAEPLPEAEYEPKTQASEDLPPDNWSQQIHQGDEFQALFFEVNGVTFAVPLTELGGIHQLGDVSRLMGRPPWYLGLMSSREHQLDVVDTACWAMPDKLDGEEYREQYKYVVVLGESRWGLACSTLLGTETLSEHSVRWREKAGKRPWLAGMVKEKMCALIHVSELISMLKAGLDVNTKLRQSC
ncbi:chemotaxis protein CheW [Photobacterium sp. DA100]|uniref:chemotaxis protein CheW n=1 Tax=Photobacterium sp. DA100 TaxID=3027472 RepID=UPI0024788700|nr:chemotaxis protein CheW [Photobacterium sp. DA100]WEM41599.1 chemotaxis protein CheW [Photobacterium sp. DA100]